MSTYTVAHKLPSMDSYTVVDASGVQVYAAKHHMGLTHESWDITDAQGHSVATLTHDRKHLHATYTVTGSGLADLTLTKVNFMPIAETWTVTGGTTGQKIVGDLADYNWTIESDTGETVATLQRKLVSLHRQYIVNVNGDSRVAIATAIALDVEEAQHK